MLLNNLFIIYNYIRRKILYLVFPGYIMQSLSERKGKCLKCGACCVGCKLLDKKGKCIMYSNRPYSCHKDFPIDVLDQKARGVENVCGYYWEEK